MSEGVTPPNQRRFTAVSPSVRIKRVGGLFPASATAFCEVLNENLQRVESAHAGPYERDRGASVSDRAMVRINPMLRDVISI